MLPLLLASSGKGGMNQGGNYNNNNMNAALLAAAMSGQSGSDKSKALLPLLLAQNKGNNLNSNGDSIMLYQLMLAMNKKVSLYYTFNINIVFHYLFL